MARKHKTTTCTCILRGQYALLDNRYTRAMMTEQGYHLYEGTDGYPKALCPSCNQALFSEWL
jgi:hypothetical protein